jgi:hypothetical protein
MGGLLKRSLRGPSTGRSVGIPTHGPTPQKGISTKTLKIAN